jgi:hypothetical protein
MCGLVGIAGAMELKDEDAMRRLLLNNYHRGKDSTGMAAVRNNGDVKIAKVTSNPIDLFDMGRFKDALSGYNSAVFLGHNRAATRGVVSTFNAHPFQFDHIVGAHNGTLYDSSQKALEKHIGYNTPVDSMAIIASIAAVGIEETVAVLDGSWAITYVDLDKGTLNFLRNKERPLWWSASKDGKVVYWASEWPTIQAGMYGEDNWGYRELWRDSKGKSYFGLEEDIHYSFSLKDLRTGGNRPKPLCKKMEGKKTFLAASGTVLAGHRTGLSDPFQRPTQLTGPRTTTPSTTTSRGKGNDNQNPVMVHLEGTEDEPFAGRITREQFEELAKGGCNFCQADIQWGDRGVAIYTKDDIILCRSHSPCGASEHTRVYLPSLD